MGKVGGSSWLNAVKKAFRSPFKDQQQDEVEKKRGKSRWIFRKPLYRETTIQHSNEETDAISETVNQASARNSASYRNINEAVQVEKRCTIAAALASAAAADAAQAAMEVVRFNTTRRPISAMRFRERLHFAAMAIQTAFRGYLARKALKALKGLVKLQAFVRGHNVRGRAKMTLQCMQSMVRVQAQLCDERSRRLSSSSSSPCLKKTKNSIFRDPINHDYICFRDTYPQMEEEIQPQEGYLNCKRRLGFSNIQEISIDNSTFENERTWFDPANTSMIKTIKVDTSQSHNFSPSPSKPLLHSINPRKSMSKPSLDNYNNYPRPVTPTKSVAQPNYMSDTASTKARIRAHSAPRMRPMTPEREHISRAAKRRISGQAQDQHNSDVDDSEFVPHFDQSMPR